MFHEFIYLTFKVVNEEHVHVKKLSRKGDFPDLEPCRHMAIFIFYTCTRKEHYTRCSMMKLWQFIVYGAS